MKRSIQTVLTSLYLLLILSLNTALAEEANQKYWIFFKDKERQSNLAKIQNDFNAKAMKRRAKTMDSNQLISVGDFPLSQSYKDKILENVTSLRTESRWLNAISVDASPEQIKTIQSLYFVDKVKPVLSYKRSTPKSEEQASLKLQKRTDTPLDYGDSYTQLQQINVPAMHQRGYYGQGVTIAMLDNGFDLYKDHIAFDSLKVLEVWDFTENDSTVEGGGHGTNTLSAIGGYAPGNLIGPAFRASYLLAKTEVNSSETPIEEDYWVAGLEWAEARGADLVSSSLGYIDWYNYADMDGETAVTTVAADSAVERGVLIFNSAGNEYNDPWHYIIAPADGNNVLAIAAVTSTGAKSGFSSVGPSYDGRIKPDLAAMGSSVQLASSYNTTGFSRSNGTSFSCPLAAGAAALLLEAYPNLTPIEVHQALRSTASQSANPDTALGWGIIDIEAAFHSIDTAKLFPFEKLIPEGLEITSNYPNPFNPSTKIGFRLKYPSFVEATIYNSAGEKIAQRAAKYYTPSTLHEMEIQLPSSVASGVYFYKIVATNNRYAVSYKKTGKMIYTK